MQIEIQRAIFDTAKTTMNFHCPSGNCTFPGTYKTMGFCNSCSDISDQVKLVQVSNSTSINYTLPFLTLAQESDVATGSFSMGSNEFNEFENLTFYSIAAWSKQSSRSACSEGDKESWKCKGYGAAMCTIWPCVQTFAASVALNELNEVASGPGGGVWAEPHGDLISRTIDMSCVNATEKAKLERDGYYFDEDTPWLAFKVSWRTPASETYATIRRQCVYEYFQKDVYSLSLYMYEYFSGNAISGVPDQPVSDASWGPTQLLEIFNNGSVSFDSYQGLFDRIANALSIFSRENPSEDAGGTDSDGLSGVANQVLGSVYYTETCIQIRWLWLIFPAVLCLLTILFFIGMVVETRWMGDDEGSWHDYKTDSLPLLFHGLGRSLLDQYQIGVTSSSSLSAEARHVQAKFEKADGTWRFVAS